VMVSPEVESSLFARLETLGKGPVRKKGVIIFSRRTAVLVALMLVLISGSLGYIVPKLLSSGTSGQVVFNTENTSLPVAQTPAISSAVSGSSNDAAISLRIAEPKIGNSINENGFSNNRYLFNRGLNSPPAISIKADDTQSIENEVRSTHPLSVSESIQPETGTEHHSPFDLRENLSDSRLAFEASIETSSGFTYPADAAPIKPFADQRLSVAYHLTENNLIGFRLGSGLYQQLGNVTSQQEGGATVLQRGIETKRSFSEELYISHLVPFFFVAPFTLEFSVGGGLIPNGYTVGAEAGIRIPLSEAFLFETAFNLSRIHSGGLSSQSILDSQTGGMQPVALEGVDIHNTLNGRLHYGIIYRF
jgi:hypothetical protein